MTLIEKSYREYASHHTQADVEFIDEHAAIFTNDNESLVIARDSESGDWFFAVHHEGACHGFSAFSGGYESVPNAVAASKDVRNLVYGHVW